ncbi:hypothetical protein [Streptacidiphilus sp. MAP5-3]
MSPVGESQKSDLATSSPTAQETITHPACDPPPYPPVQLVQWGL